MFCTRTPLHGRWRAKLRASVEPAAAVPSSFITRAGAVSKLGCSARWRRPWPAKPGIWISSRRMSSVTRPFPMPAYGTLPAGPLIEAYEKATAESAARILAYASEAAKTNGIACETSRCKGRRYRGSYCRNRPKQRLRPDRGGFARLSRRDEASSRQCRDEGPHAQQHVCPDMPLAICAIGHQSPQRE